MITDDNYYDPSHALTTPSCSDYKRVMQCEAMAVAHARGDWIQTPFPAQIEGSYGHAIILEPHTIPAFTKEHEAFMYQKNKKELLANFRKVKLAVDTLQSNDFFMKCFNECKVEEIMLYDFHGIQWRSKIDMIGDGWIADIKFLGSLDATYNTDGNHPLLHWGYLTQMALYGWGYKQLHGKWPKIYIFCVTKEYSPSFRCIELDHEGRLRDFIAIESELMNIIENIENKVERVWKGMTVPTSCGSCPYCKSKIDTAMPVPWETIYTNQQLKDLDNVKLER